MKTIRHELKASIDRAVKAEAKVRNEVTGTRVSKIAGRILQYVEAYSGIAGVYAADQGDLFVIGSVGELKAICASCLTQSKDRPKKGAKK